MDDRPAGSVSEARADSGSHGVDARASLKLEVFRDADCLQVDSNIIDSIGGDATVVLAMPNSTSLLAQNIERLSAKSLRQNDGNSAASAGQQLEGSNEPKNFSGNSFPVVSQAARSPRRHRESYPEQLEATVTAIHMSAASEVQVERHDATSNSQFQVDNDRLALISGNVASPGLSGQMEGQDSVASELDSQVTGAALPASHRDFDGPGGLRSPQSLVQFPRNITGASPSNLRTQFSESCDHDLTDSVQAQSQSHARGNENRDGQGPAFSSVAPKIDPESEHYRNLDAVNYATNTNLLINYLPNDMDDSELHSYFSAFGEIISTKIVKHRQTNRSLGYGFVRFLHEPHARAAIEHMNGRVIRSKTLKVAFARPPSVTIRDCKLYVTNLPVDSSVDSVQRLFSQFGEIIECRVVGRQPTSQALDSNTSASRLGGSIAFIQFSNRNEAHHALSLNGLLVSEGHKISVRHAEPHVPATVTTVVNRSYRDRDGHGKELGATLPEAIISLPGQGSLVGPGYPSHFRSDHGPGPHSHDDSESGFLNFKMPVNMNPSIHSPRLQVSHAGTPSATGSYYSLEGYDQPSHGDAQGSSISPSYGVRQSEILSSFRPMPMAREMGNPPHSTSGTGTGRHGRLRHGDHTRQPHIRDRNRGFPFVSMPVPVPVEVPGLSHGHYQNQSGSGHFLQVQLDPSTTRSNRLVNPSHGQIADGNYPFHRIMSHGHDGQYLMLGQAESPVVEYPSPSQVQGQVVPGTVSIQAHPIPVQYPSRQIATTTVCSSRRSNAFAMTGSGTDEGVHQDDDCTNTSGLNRDSAGIELSSQAQLEPAGTESSGEDNTTVTDTETTNATLAAGGPGIGSAGSRPRHRGGDETTGIATGSRTRTRTQNYSLGNDHGNENCHDNRGSDSRADSGAQFDERSFRDSYGYANLNSTLNPLAEVTVAQAGNVAMAAPHSLTSSSNLPLAMPRYHHRRHNPTSRVTTSVAMLGNVTNTLVPTSDSRHDQLIYSGRTIITLTNLPTHAINPSILQALFAPFGYLYNAQLQDLGNGLMTLTGEMTGFAEAQTAGSAYHGRPFIEGYPPMQCTISPILFSPGPTFSNA